LRVSYPWKSVALSRDSQTLEICWRLTEDRGPDRPGPFDREVAGYPKRKRDDANAVFGDGGWMNHTGLEKRFTRVDGDAI